MKMGRRIADRCDDRPDDAQYRQMVRCHPGRHDTTEAVQKLTLTAGQHICLNPLRRLERPGRPIADISVKQLKRIGNEL